MKNWEINAVEYAETKNPGKCPECGSENVEVEVMKFPNHIGIFFKCNDCGSFEHLDGAIP